ncbi:MAG: lysozyme [Lachnospiraceae bacterium]|nr:lysozyme [Lachnospiraceae bacterium]
MKNKSKKLCLILFVLMIACETLATDLNLVDYQVIPAKLYTGTGRVNENKTKLEAEGREHSVKYYAYQPSAETDPGDFFYFDAAGTSHKMLLNRDAYKTDVEWDQNSPVAKKGKPLNYDVEIGVDVSKYNGDIDWGKVKEAGIDFAFVRLVYRGYGEKGTLLEDKKGVENLIAAKAVGIKVGAYIFSQAINEAETIEEAALAIKLLSDNGIVLDLPLVYDPETLRGVVARTDDVTGETFTNNAIAFSEYVLKNNIRPCIYANMIWEDYYFDMAKLRDYDFWYADYYDFPFTPYKYKYWQFSERGKVPGITDKDHGYVDLNIMLVEK